VYLKMLGEGFRRNRAFLGAYCLMANHIHLLVFRQSTSLGTIFRQINMAYANYFNERHGKTGYVFQGRFKSFIVLDDVYLAVLLRYIHENPVMAGIAKSVHRYLWSSDAFYRHDRGASNALPLVRVPGFEGRAGSRSYEELMAGDPADLKQLPISGQIIGTEQEIKEVNRRSRTQKQWFRENRRDRDALGVRIESLLRPQGLSLSEIAVPSQKRTVSRIRSQLMGQLYKEGYPPSQIAKAFKMTATAVLRAYERCF